MDLLLFHIKDVFVTFATFRGHGGKRALPTSLIVRGLFAFDVRVVSRGGTVLPSSTNHSGPLIV